MAVVPDYTGFPAKETGGPLELLGLRLEELASGSLRRLGLLLYRLGLLLCWLSLLRCGLSVFFTRLSRRRVGRSRFMRFRVTATVCRQRRSRVTLTGRSGKSGAHQKKKGNSFH